MKVFLVGGAVRDELLGRPVSERDYVVVGATPAALTAAGYRAVGKDFPVGARFLQEECIKEGYTVEDAKLIALRMAQLGIDYISLSIGGKFEDAVHVEGEPLYPYTGYSGDRCMPGEWYPPLPHLANVATIKQYLASHGYNVPVVAAGKISDPADAELAELARRFTGALEQLKRRRLGAKGSRRWLYQLPWYAMIGPPGSGKTTALTQSGLRFPLAQAREIRGVAGTRYCDWFFTDEAVLIDTAGRYTSQDSDRDGDAKAWRGFLELLRRRRPRQPLNGVLVAISVSELVAGRDRGGFDHAATVRSRLARLFEHRHRITARDHEGVEAG